MKMYKCVNISGPIANYGLITVGKLYRTTDQPSAYNRNRSAGSGEVMLINDADKPHYYLLSCLEEVKAPTVFPGDKVLVEATVARLGPDDTLILNSPKNSAVREVLEKAKPIGVGDMVVTGGDRVPYKIVGEFEDRWIFNPSGKRPNISYRTKDHYFLAPT